LNAFGNCIHHENATSQFTTSLQGGESALQVMERFPDGFPVNNLKPFVESMSAAPHDMILCALQHGSTESCTTALFSQFMDETVRALSLYAPLNGVNFSVIHRIDHVCHL
jgi:hypothetical protein